MKKVALSAALAASFAVSACATNPYGYNDPWTRVNVVKTAKRSVTAGANGAFSFTLPPLSVAVLDTASGQSRKRGLRG